MNYRKLKKEYSKKFGIRMKIKLYDKHNKVFKKASKLVTADKMRRSLNKTEPFLGIFATDSKYDRSKNKND